MSTAPKSKLKIPSVRTVYLIPVKLLEEAPWNPSEPSKRNLDLLVGNIREVGFIENLVVAPLEDMVFDGKVKVQLRGEKTSLPDEAGLRVTGGRFQIISGHDKWKAAQVLSVEAVPCTIVPEWDEDMRKLQAVRMNVIHKHLDPLKFTTLLHEFSKKYGDELAKAMWSFTDESMLQELIEKTKTALPKEMQGELEKRKKKISSIDDLTSIVSELHSRGGATLDHGYMIFSFGGHEHIYVQLTKKLREAVNKIVNKSKMEKKHISEIFLEELGVE